MGARSGGGAQPPPLPCLNTNNSDKSSFANSQALSASHRKVAHALAKNVQGLVDRVGLERVGFLTLTFADHVLNAKEAGRRFNNLARRVLGRYSEWIAVIERQTSGRIHFHLLVGCSQDVRTGFDFAAVKAKNYRSAGEFMRQEWAFWRRVAPRYGFGRCELLPVKSNAEGIAKYVGKYIAKHIGARKAEDKGVRLVRYAKGAGRNSCRFGWVTPGADLWRIKLGSFCRELGLSESEYCATFKHWFGENWIFVLRPIIESIRLDEYSTGKHAEVDFPGVCPEGMESDSRQVRPGRQSHSNRLTVGAAVIVALREKWRLQCFQRDQYVHKVAVFGPDSDLGVYHETVLPSPRIAVQTYRGGASWSHYAIPLDS